MKKLCEDTKFFRGLTTDGWLNIKISRYKRHIITYIAVPAS